MISRALACATLLSSSAYYAEVSPVLAAGESQVIAAERFLSHPAETLQVAEVIIKVRHDQLLMNQDHDYRVAPETVAQARLRLTRRADQVEELQKSRSASNDGSDSLSTAMDRFADASIAIGLMDSRFTAYGTALKGVSATYSLAKSLVGTANPEPMTAAQNVVENVAWALDEAQRKTGAGQALNHQLVKLGIDPSVPLAKQPIILQIKEKEKNEGLTGEVARVRKKDEALQKQVLDLNRKLEAIPKVVENTPSTPAANTSARASTPVPLTPAELTNRQLIAGSLWETSSSATAAGYGALLFNRPAEARIAFGVAEVAGRAATAFNPGELGAAALTGNYFAMALAVKNLMFQAKQPESPFPALFEALAQLSKQIDQLGKSLTNDIARLDARLGALLEKVVLTQESIENDTIQIREQINVIQRQIDQFQQEMRAENFAIADILIGNQDRACIRYDGEGKPVPPFTDFLQCRDMYIHRATEYSRGPLAKADAAAQRTLQMTDFRADFPLSFAYDDVARDWNYAGSRSGALLPDPRAWMKTTGSFLELLRNNPDQLRDVQIDRTSEGSASETLDPMIGAGNELLAFYDWAALSKSATPNDILIQNVTQTIDELGAGYAKVLDNLKMNMVTAGLRADLARDTLQEIPDGSSFNFQKGVQVHTCEVGQPLVVRNSQTYWLTKWGFDGAVPASAEWDNNITHWGKTFGNLNDLQPPSKFSSNIARPLLWLELDNPQRFRVEPCLRSVVIENLNMNDQPRATVTVAYDIYLHDLTKNTRALAQSLTGTLQNAKFSQPRRFNLISINKNNPDFRGKQLVETLWNEAMMSSWPHMETLPLDEKNAGNLQILTDLAEAILAKKRADIEIALHLEDVSKKIEGARRRIAAAVSAGTQTHTATAERFLRTLIQDPVGLVAPADLVGNVLSGRTTVELERARVAALLEQLKVQWNELAALHESSIAPSIIAERIHDLEVVRTLRTTLPKAKLEVPPNRH